MATELTKPVPADLVHQLAGIRYPAEFASFDWQDALFFTASGILLAMLLAMLLRPLFRQKFDFSTYAEAEIARVSGAEKQIRIFHLARLLRQLQELGMAGSRPQTPKTSMDRVPEAVFKSLYDPHADADPAIMERAIRKEARKLGLQHLPDRAERYRDGLF